MTIVESDRGQEELSSPDVFTWSELPDLLAAEDLFAGVGAATCPDTVARDEEDDEFDDEEEDEEFDDDDEEEEEDEEEDWD